MDRKQVNKCNRLVIKNILPLSPYLSRRIDHTLHMLLHNFFSASDIQPVRGIISCERATHGLKVVSTEKVA